MRSPKLLLIFALAALALFLAGVSYFNGSVKAANQSFNVGLSIESNPVMVGANNTVTFTPTNAVSNATIYVDDSPRVSGRGLLTWHPLSLTVGSHAVKGCDTDANLCNTENLIVTNSPIKNVIIIFQENHAFDNYFGTFPGAFGFEANTCEPVNPAAPNAGCVRPWRTLNASQPQMAHAWKSSQAAFDNGSFAGFISSANGSRLPMSYYDYATIPYYWDYAKRYVLLDHLFSSALTYSTANHWYEVAANAPEVSIKADGFNSTTKPIYINESQSIDTLAQSLLNSSISWMYYSEKQEAPNLSTAIKNGTAFYYWNPLFAQNISYTKPYRPHFAFTSTIFNNISQGTLPEVSWVSPTFALSEHPPANVTQGMWYVTSLIDSVMRSKYWNSTLIIVMWDDYGGYYDGVTPPKIATLGGQQTGLAFRVPGLIVSPYSKQGYIDHTVYDFESTMKFLEWNFGLKNLTYRDGNANNLLPALNFSQQPSSPYIIPLNEIQNRTIQIGLSLNSYARQTFGTNGSGSVVNSNQVINNNEPLNDSGFET